MTHAKDIDSGDQHIVHTVLVKATFPLSHHPQYLVHYFFPSTCSTWVSDRQDIVFVYS